MSSTTEHCIYCNKGCKNSDSRPFPCSKSKDRIHNKCHIKKTLAHKKQPEKMVKATPDHQKLVSETLPITSLADRMSKEESEIKRAINEKKMSKLNDESRKINEASNQCFFDLKAGIAKPHEKRQYLKHRNLCEIAARYDDNGFSEEAVGRAYDHQGKDLNTISDSDGDNPTDGGEDELIQDGINAKRKNNQTTKKQTLTARKRLTIQVDGKNPCWFCLSSPQVEKHLIIAIGDYCYLTLAKGGLNDNHLLILPIEHIQSLNDDANSAELMQELGRFKKSLVDYFGTKSLGVVFFERNFRSVHWQLQVVPIPLEVIDTIQDDIITISKEHFKNSDYLDISAEYSLSDMIPPNVPYFFWNLEPIGSRFVTQIQVRGSFFPVQLGRIILADPRILDCEDRIDWKKCVKSQEEYAELVTKTKKDYEKFDIT